MEVPGPDCPTCPRLVAFREDWRAREPGWHNAPVPSFGPLDARLLIVGLAPGLRGANRTGRPFTGDFAGDLLYPTLVKFGFARGDYGREAADGLTMADCRITNAVRCVPPENKPTGAEIRACGGFLAGEMGAMPRLTVVVALGAVAHGAALRVFGASPSRHKFGHGARHDLGSDRPTLVDSYHCSRYNTNTGKLTVEMFETLFADLRARMDG